MRATGSYLNGFRAGTSCPAPDRLTCLGPPVAVDISACRLSLQESVGITAQKSPLKEDAMSHKTQHLGNAGIDIVVAQDSALATLCGRIEIDSSPAVRDRLVALLQAPAPKKINIDLSAVSHIDSSGVATLIEALRIARRNKSELRLQGLHGRLLRMFESTGILSLFNGTRANQSGSKVV